MKEVSQDVLMKPGYCTNETVENCRECSLSNYGRDCRNNPINQRETVTAALHGDFKENRDLTAECPYCGLSDGYVSTGEHSDHGSDTVRCSGCGRVFEIRW